MAAAARRTFSRALRRPGRSITVALLVTASIVWARARAAPSYRATLYFRLVEGEVGDSSNAPHPPATIRAYVTDVALSRSRLERIMRKYGLSSALLARDKVAAIDGFREDIGIDVSRNYFIYDRGAGDPPRTAQIVLSLSGVDPEQTSAILHEVGDAIVQEQTARRSSALARARQLLEEQLRRARARVKSLQLEIYSAEEGSAEQTIDARARIAALEPALQAALHQVVLLERRSASVSFSTAAEHESLGLNLELFDESLLASSPRLSPLQLAGLGALVFPFVSVLVLAVAGAFDDRVYGQLDLEARGLSHFGSLPRLTGDDVGAFMGREERNV